MQAGCGNRQPEVFLGGCWSLQELQEEVPSSGKDESSMSSSSKKLPNWTGGRYTTTKWILIGLVMVIECDSNELLSNLGWLIGRFRFRGVDRVKTTCSNRIVVPGSTKYYPRNMPYLAKSRWACDFNCWLLLTRYIISIFFIERIALTTIKKTCNVFL